MTTSHDGPAGFLPEDPAIAVIAASLFKRLGGEISTDGGRRCLSKPEAVLFEMRGESLPQLPDAEPHEQFHSAEEWRGALKLAEYLINRLSPADRDLVFALAPVHVHPIDDFDFRDMLR